MKTVLKIAAGFLLFLFITAFAGYLFVLQESGMLEYALEGDFASLWDPYFLTEWTEYLTQYLYGLCVSAGLGILVAAVWLLLHMKPRGEKPQKAPKPPKASKAPKAPKPPKPAKASKASKAAAAPAPEYWPEPPARTQPVAGEQIFAPYMYSGLAGQPADGVPVGARLVSSPDGMDLQISLARPANTLIAGDATGCKAIIGHTARILSRTVSAPSFVVADTDGELFHLHAKALSERGYSVNVVDLSGAYPSLRYNPLLCLWDIYEEYTKAETGIFKRQDDPSGSGLSLHNPPHAFGEIYYEYRGRAYADSRELVEVIQKRKRRLYEDLRENANAIAALLYAETADGSGAEIVASEAAAKELLDMLEDSKNPVIDMTRERFTLALLNRNLTKTGKTPLPAAFSGKFAASLTAACDFGARVFFERPSALFIISAGERQALHGLAALTLLSLYRSLADAPLGDNLPGRSVYFLLESFGHMPKIENFEKLLTAEHHRRIWLLAASHSLAHLDALYGAAAGRIKESFGVNLFIGPGDEETSREFSWRSVYGKGPLCTAEELMNLNTLADNGDALAIVPGCPPMRTVFTPVRLVPFYMPQDNHAQTQAQAQEANP
jgi:type IV secretion system protein VirD4